MSEILDYLYLISYIIYIWYPVLFIICILYYLYLIFFRLNILNYIYPKFCFIFIWYPVLFIPNILNNWYLISCIFLMKNSELFIWYLILFIFDIHAVLLIFDIQYYLFDILYYYLYSIFCKICILYPLLFISDIRYRIFYSSIVYIWYSTLFTRDVQNYLYLISYMYYYYYYYYWCYYYYYSVMYLGEHWIFLYTHNDYLESNNFSY